MLLKRTALFILCLWLFLMAMTARSYLALIVSSGSPVPSLFRLLMDGFWIVQIIIWTTGCICARRNVTTALVSVALCEALLWQVAIMAHTAVITAQHTRWWLDGVEAPSHMNPNPTVNDK